MSHIGNNGYLVIELEKRNAVVVVTKSIERFNAFVAENPLHGLGAEGRYDEVIFMTQANSEEGRKALLEDGYPEAKLEKEANFYHIKLGDQS